MKDSQTLTLQDFQIIIHNIHTTIKDNVNYLCELDSSVGDGDHGTTLERGLSAAVKAIEESPPDSISNMLQTTGKTMISSMGGASGPLFGSLFREMGRASTELDEVTLSNLHTMLDRAASKIMEMGKAERGDKTLLDALLPAVDSLQQSIADGASLPDALTAMAKAAQSGAVATQEMVATKGRARYAGERGRGRQDAGATSIALIMQTIADTVSKL